MNRVSALRGRRTRLTHPSSFDHIRNNSFGLFHRRHEESNDEVEDAESRERIPSGHVAGNKTLDGCADDPFEDVGASDDCGINV